MIGGRAAARPAAARDMMRAAMTIVSTTLVSSMLPGGCPFESLQFAAWCNLA
jgi:hypothetical protein